MQAFWVGLMDGDGSIQVNHWKQRYLQYRMVIKLKNTDANVAMLNNICAAIGGGVRVSPSYVLWVENSKDRMKSLLSLFERCPPLTTRLQCQLDFLEACLARNDFHWYITHRNHKYKSQPHKIHLMQVIGEDQGLWHKTAPVLLAGAKGLSQAQDVFLPPLQEEGDSPEEGPKLPKGPLGLRAPKVFLQATGGADFRRTERKRFFLSLRKKAALEPQAILLEAQEHGAECEANEKQKANKSRVKKHLFSGAWLSGFIEAEGFFCIRGSGYHSFSIAQKHDDYLLKALHAYFKGSNRIRECSNNMYVMEIYRRQSLMQVIQHCNTYPLCGEKLVSFQRFEQVFSNKRLVF